MTNFKTPEGFTRWYDQKCWGSKKGSFGKSKETTGKILSFSEFIEKMKFPMMRTGR